MVDRLCLQLFENSFPVDFNDRRDFCVQIANHVVNHRKVRNLPQRVCDLEFALDKAVEEGRILVHQQCGRTRIVLSDDEKEYQTQLAQERKEANEAKKLERRRRNGRRGREYISRQLPIHDMV